MKYQLVMKNTGEIVTITDRKVFGIDEAKAYYVRMKQLKEKEFDKLYIVEEYKQPKGMPFTGRGIRWWEEEFTNLDDF
jgi:hypothetical protein